MATILDVAKLAGVSQGTASNVLNGKGNVSSEKIKLVEEAARQLGYTINERAKILRKGSGNLICIILPSIEYKKYRNFYYSLKYYVERNGYLTELLLSNDNPQTEKELIQRAQAMMAAGVVSISCIQEKQNYYQDKGFEHVIFVERKPEFACDYFGFDYEKAGEELAKQVLEKENGTPLQSVIYENDGIKNWADIEIGNKVAKNINILTLESPEANIMKGLAKIYTEKTGIAVNVSIFSYDEIYEQFLLAETFDKYDVLRILEGFMEDSYVEGKIYSIPFQRSTEIVYYNKDAFREVGLDPERPPKTWDELVEYGKKLTNDKRYGVGIALNFDRRCGKHLLQRRFF